MPNMSHKTSSDVESHQDEPAPLLLTRVTRPPQGRDAERGTISGTYARAEGGVTGVRTSEAREEEDRAFLEENNELTAKIAETQKELMGAQEKLAEASREADLWQEVLDEADGRVTDAFQALPMESGEAGLQLAEHDLLRWAKARNLMGRKDQWAGQKQKESILSAYTQEALQQDASGKTPELLEQYSFALERKDTAMAQYAVVEQAARPSFARRDYAMEAHKTLRDALALLEAQRLALQNKQREEQKKEEQRALRQEAKTAAIEKIQPKRVALLVEAIQAQKEGTTGLLQEETRHLFKDFISACAREPKLLLLFETAVDGELSPGAIDLAIGRMIQEAKKRLDEEKRLAA